MSGGVDSSVAAALLKEQGYQVTGVTMKIWDGTPLAKKGVHHGCYGPEEEEDIEDARKVAQTLGIPYQVIDLTSQYKSVVLDYFCEEYLSGRTPNPCARCNQIVKFGALVERARDAGLDFDFIASGHYARVDYDDKLKRYLLKKAKDISKDQTYFLYSLSQEQLSRLLFPLGNYTKAEIREIASRYGLQVADKPDSQNFIPGDYSAVFPAQPEPGPIMDKEGKVLGQHRGIQFYTIGQRKGLGIPSQEASYVIATNAARNAVIVGHRNDIFKDDFIANKLNWIATRDLCEPVVLKARIRSSHKEVEALVTPIDDESVLVKFKEPQMAITPGQVVVFYNKDTVVGGGIIENLPL
ncbi:MAG: tRNA 2-thiouridine(34) synthase MnmA [Chloroflexi bacterium RBG_16_48_7]|nr:MAG: tRNA 2-thiouridine(34) synthase MnmA [Chloroflexi bacterium RBG_16_48_7]